MPRIPTIFRGAARSLASLGMTREKCALGFLPLHRRAPPPSPMPPAKIRNRDPPSIEQPSNPCPTPERVYSSGAALFTRQALQYSTGVQRQRPATLVHASTAFCRTPSHAERLRLCKYECPAKKESAHPARVRAHTVSQSHRASCHSAAVLMIKRPGRGRPCYLMWHCRQM